MSTIPTTPVVHRPLRVAAPASHRPGRCRLARVADKSRLYLALLLLLGPTVIGMAVFNYYPKLQTVRYSLYNWDGQMTEEFVGLKNYLDAFTRDPLFWPTFQLVGILLVANLVKMWPSILTAIVLHRVRSDRWQYVYRILFVLPMVIPGVVWLLVWKSFFDPTTGTLNSFLNHTGLMSVLARLDAFMPKMAAAFAPLLNRRVDPVFGGVTGMLLAAALLLSVPRTFGGFFRRWFWWLLVLVAAAAASGPGRAVVLLPATLLLGVALDRTTGGAAARRGLGVGLAAAAILLALAGKIWTEPTGQFSRGTPAWLGNTKLVIPSLILWGFPWIGTVGVLIYLAGLQGITQDVYEAAELDGVSSLGKVFRIELPLILTQVRINLIFMTIGTLNDYGLILLLLGPDGGPGNVGMTPGLYMYREAFVNGRFGYACALGMVLFVIILSITAVYQKYLKVEK